MSHVLITGASSGIGAALARHYADTGVTLSLCGRDKERLNTVAEACRAEGAAVDATIMDVTDQEGMRRWINTRDAVSPLTLVVANAGVGETGGNTRLLFTININGVLNTIDPAIDLMQERGAGQIALVASLAGYRGLPHCAPYAASKGFVKLYGEGLRGALAPLGVRVNVICPGFVRSRITDTNTCPMPFFMEAETAAAIIAKGLQRNRGRIAFPWPMAFALWFLSILPDGPGRLVDPLSAGKTLTTSAKVRSDNVSACTI